MERPRVEAQVHRHLVFEQPLGIDDGLVAQRVELGGADMGRG